MPRNDRRSTRPLDRRTVLAAIGTLGTAGCSALGGTGSGESDGCDPRAEELDGPVPSPYETAKSAADVPRTPGRLLPKADAEYRREPNGEQRCATCSYYVADRNGDCLGACVRVEGPIDPEGWCEYYRTQTGGGW